MTAVAYSTLTVTLITLGGKLRIRVVYFAVGASVLQGVDEGRCERAQVMKQSVSICTIILIEEYGSLSTVAYSNPLSYSLPALLRHALAAVWRRGRVAQPAQAPGTSWCGADYGSHGVR